MNWRCITFYRSCLAAAVTVVAACGGEDGVTEPPSTGSIEVTAATTGDDVDPDGYTITVDGGTGQSIGSNASTTFTEIATGNREVELTGVASNCTVAGSNPRTVTVAEGGTASTSFDVGCFAPLRGQIAFQMSVDGSYEIFVMGAEGSNLVNLTENPADDFRPAISPDGTKIAFVRRLDGNNEIFVMNADGSDPTNLTNDEASDVDPDWSPDGTRIAFTTDRDGSMGIYVMDADGSNLVRLTNDPAFDRLPSWSPDGTRMAFSRSTEIYVMDADGSNPVDLTNGEGGGHPSWSPDGTRIAFVAHRDAVNDVFVMDDDGSNVVNLTDDPASDFDPDWSPDGTRIALSKSNDIYVMDADGSNLVILMVNAVADLAPDWSPQ